MALYHSVPQSFTRNHKTSYHDIALMGAQYCYTVIENFVAFF